MATVVETFVIEETAPLIYDNEQLDKWSAHVAALGLTGQTKIVKKDKSPIPFMHLKTSMMEVFSILCPRKVSIQNYDVTPIPVEILDLAALAIKEEHFNRIEIWYDEKSPDPACIGIASEFYVYGYGGVPKSVVEKTFPNRAAALAAIHEVCPDFKSTDSFGWETNTRYYLLGKWADVKRSFKELKQMASERFMAEEGYRLKKAIKEAERDLSDLETKAFEKFN